MEPKIAYFQHAVERMNEQHISERDVEDVLRNADTIASARLGRLNAYRNDVEGWMLRVTYVVNSGTIEAPKKLTVITVYAEQRS